MAYPHPPQFETYPPYPVAQPTPQRPQDGMSQELSQPSQQPTPHPEPPKKHATGEKPTDEQLAHAEPLPPPQGGDMVEELIFMESQTWEALKLSGKALIPFLSPDCVMLFPSADIFDANSDPSLYDILSRPDMKPWLKYKMDEIHVIPLGRDAAAISYSVEAHRHKQEYMALVSSVWKRQGDSWRMCLHQQTPI